MPPWLLLLLFVTAMVLWVGIEAGLTTASWNGFRAAIRYFGGTVLVIGVIGAVMAAYVFIVRS